MVVVVIVHVVWVQRLVIPEARSYEWTKALVSPLLMVGVWMAFTRLLLPYAPATALSLYAVGALGGLAGFAVLVVFERIVVPRQARWETLMRVIAMPVPHALTYGSLILSQPRRS